MINPILRTIGAGAVFVLSSCNSALTEESFLNDYATALCDRARPCCEAAHGALNEQTCRTGALLMNTVENQFDPEIAAKCLNAVKEWKCTDSLLAIYRVCGWTYALIGSPTPAPIGGLCGVDSDCVQRPSMHSYCNGVCAAFPVLRELGEPCVPDHEANCDDGQGLVCVEDPKQSLGGVCRLLPHLGEPCYYGIDSSGTCAEGFRCGPDKTCISGIGKGQPCVGFYECGEGLECVPASAGVCVERSPSFCK